MTPENPPAFPIAYKHEYPNGMIATQEHSGMTLRDYFAGKALLGVVQECLSAGQEVGFIAHVAYKLADAMLAEREKKGTP
jgi:hypothetical protein